MCNKLKRFWNYYVKGNYHCDTCPYCWEERGYEDADAGCYIYGDLRDSCRLLPPFRFLIGWGRRKKAQYLMNHEYDGYVEFIEEREKQESYVEKAMKEWLDHNGYVIALNTNDDTRLDVDKFSDIYCLSDSMRDIFSPVKYEPLKKRWGKLLKDTWQRFLMIFKPYFCK